MKSLKKISELADRFESKLRKYAQMQTEYTVRPMDKAMQSVKSGVAQLVPQIMTKHQGITSVSIDLEWQPPNVKFSFFSVPGRVADNDELRKAAVTAFETDLNNALTAKYGASVTQIMNKYQKDQPTSIKLGAFP